jgi:hypothetical protein
LKQLDDKLLHNIKTGKITGETKPFKPAGSIPTNCQGLMKERIDAIVNMLKKEKKPTPQTADGNAEDETKPQEKLTRTEKLKKSKKV